MATVTKTRHAARPGVVATFITTLSTALGVAVGFAWNSAVQELNRSVFSRPHFAVPAAFAWALAVTAIAVLIVVNMRSFIPEELPHLPEEEEHEASDHAW
jgi:hypothetical protein